MNFGIGFSKLEDSEAAAGEAIKKALKSSGAPVFTMQINSASEEDMLLSELSVIYSISSLAFFQDEEDLLQAALNIATLSFGVHYFGLIHLCNGDYSVKISNGFKNPEHMCCLKSRGSLK